VTLEKRTILAFVLSMAVLIVFQQLQAWNAPPKPPAGASSGAASGASTTPGALGDLDGGPGAAFRDAALGATLPAIATPEAAAPAAETSTAAAAAPTADAYPVEERAIESDLVRAVFSTRGAELISWQLKGYRSEGETGALDLLKPGGASSPALVLSISRERAESVAWAVEESTDRSIVFRSPPMAGGVIARKAFRFAKERFALEVDISLENPGPARESGYALFATTVGITPVDDGHEFVPKGQGLNGSLSGVAGVVDGASVKLKTELATKIPARGAADQLEYVGNTSYGGVASKYFAAILMPGKDIPSPTLFLQGTKVPLGPGREPLHGVTAGYRVAPPTARLVLPAAGKIEHRFVFFAGPKVDDILGAFATEKLDRLVDYTSVIPGAETLSSLFLAVLRRLYELTGSWGVAIICLTFLVRAAVHPLSRASIKNMDKMQRLSPKIKEIQKKYEGRKSKEAQQKQTLEVMELYKKHNASPVLGCLPTLVQFPVFIGLYNSLAYSIELRQTTFLYMQDLAKPDRLFSFGGANVPFFGGFFNLLPLLMVGAMIAQQRMQPPPADPQAAQQAKMMQYMMVFFGALFYHVPAGLVVYFLTSSLLGMAETAWVKRQIAREHAAI